MFITRWLHRLLSPGKETRPDAAYDLWAAAYDHQPGNLMLDLDEIIFANFLQELDLGARTIADVGCGTGRHWGKMIAAKPAHLIGFDVSAGMLDKLKEKFPSAETYLLANDRLPQLSDKSCDIVISTLAVAHIPEIKGALKEWDRVIKPGGDIIITDYHPDLLAKGAKRTFKHEGKLISVKNYVHPVEAIRETARQLGWKELRFTERVIDESIKSHYEQQNALPVFEKYKGIPIIYGIHLKKADDPA